MSRGNKLASNMLLPDIARTVFRKIGLVLLVLIVACQSDKQLADSKADGPRWLAGDHHIHTRYSGIRPVNPIFPLLKLLFNLSETRFQQSKGNKQNDTTADFTFRASPRDVSSYRTLSRERHDTKTFL